MSGTERRRRDRVEFERGVDVRMIAIDGTWRRDCMMKDVADSGARLILGGSIEGLNLKEFFLLLSSTGCAFRRCELAWVDGEEIGVFFMNRPGQKVSRSEPA
jgi:hypothetical protein